MFPRRIASQYVNEEESSEATRADLAKALAFMRRAAPLPEEKQRQSLVGSLPSSSAVKRTLNFDESANDSFTFAPPTLPGLKVRLVEVEQENENLKKRLSIQKDTIEKLESGSQDQQKTIESLRSELTELRKEALYRAEEKREQDSLNESMMSKLLSEDYRQVAKKYLIWFAAAKQQLNAAEQILRGSKLWNKENKKKLLAAQRLTPIEDETLDWGQLAEGSVQDFASMSGLEDENDIEDGNEEETVSFARPSICISPIRADEPPQYDSSPALNQSSIMNSTLFNTSIDYEKDEKISRLEVEKEKLLLNLKLASGRAQQALLLQEEKRGLEEQVKMLKNKLDKYIAESEALRAASARQMFSLSEVSVQSKAMKMTDRIRDMQIMTTDLKDQLSKKAECEKQLRAELNAMERKKAEIENEHGSVMAANAELTRACDEQAEQLSSKEEVIRALSTDRSKLEAELAKAESTIRSLEAQVGQLTSQLAAGGKKAEPTDAGDTTQIFHFAANPLQLAHDNLIQEEEANRKRKLSEGSSVADTSLGAKRARDDQVVALENKLTKLEKDKAHSASIHANFVKKYRTIVKVLTGYDIKVKNIEEGICYAESTYDKEKQFVFKYCFETQVVDLLDVEQSVCSQHRPWETEMRRYIGERQSVPAFLAAVTLALEAERDIAEAEFDERSPTYSVLHAD